MAEPEPRQEEVCLGGQVHRLTKGEKVERQLGPSERHCYEIELEAGEFVEIEATQDEGLDVALTVELQDGVTLTFDFDNQGPEPLLWIAPRNEVLRFRLVGYEEDDVGQYGLAVVRLEAARAEDEERFAAVRGFAEADGYRRAAGDRSGSEALDLREFAIEDYELAAKGLLDLGEIELAMVALERLSWVYDEIVRPEAELRVLQRLVKVADQTTDLTRQAWARSQIANLLTEAGDLLDAVRWNLEALERYERAGNQVQVMQVMSNIGGDYLGLGEFAEAERALFEVVEYSELHGDPVRGAYALWNLATLYLNVGRPHEATAKFARVEELLRNEEVSQAWPEWAQLKVLSAMGGAYLGSGQLGAARDILERARRAAVSSGDVKALASVLMTQAELELVERHYQDSAVQYSEAIEIYQKTRNVRQQIRGWLGLTATHIGLGKFEDAVAYGLEARKNSAKVDYQLGEQGAWYQLSRAWHLGGNDTSACLAALKAIELREARSLNSDRIDLRTSILSFSPDYLGLAIDSCLIAAREEGPISGVKKMLFELSDRSRARRLFDTLTASDQRRMGCKGGAALPNTEMTHLAEAIAQNQRLKAVGASADEKGLAKRVLDDGLEEYRRGDRLRMASDFGQQTSENGPFLRLEEIQGQVLDAETLLLQFDLGDPRSYLWAVTDDRFEVFTLPAAEELKELIAELRQLLAQSYRVEVQGALADALLRTSKALLGPVASMLGRRERLAIVADGPLHGIPIGMLPHPDSLDGGDSLLEEHQVVYPLSASSIKWLRSRSLDCAPPPKQIAVIADPVFGRGDPRTEESELDLVVGSAAATPLREGSAEELPRLANSGREAREVLAGFPSADRLILLGFEANKQTVLRSNLGDYRALLFSTHGASHSQQPEFSRLELSRIDREGGVQNGALYAYEIGTLDLRAELVVLSSCESALGPAISGEGPVGLTHSFLSAGAARTLVSLWQVDDEASATLVSTFFRLWHGEGLGPAEALQQAQLTLRGREGGNRPFFWAGFVLRGDW